MEENRVKLKRKACGLSQTELASLAHVTRQTIGLIEAGDFNPSIRLCVAICKALGATLDELFWPDTDASAERSTQ